MAHCATYGGSPDTLATWLKDTGAFISHEGYPETDHPFIIRHLLIDDALDYYQAHEDIIFNFYDLRKLFLHKNHALAPLRTLSSLDSLATLTLNSIPSILTSTQLHPNPTTVPNNQSTATIFTFAHFRDALPRLFGKNKDEPEGILCQTKPVARYGMMACCRERCFLCQPR
jgi:hypothetical protein